MQIKTDIETLPQEGTFDQFMADAESNFKAPSTLSKGQACIELGMTDAKDIKFTSKDEAIRLWEQKFSKEKAPEVADHNYRATALDGAKGRVCSIAWKSGAGETKSLSLATCDTEERLLATFFLELAKPPTDLNHTPERNGSNKPYFIGHNIPFDLKFLFRRCVMLGIDPMVRLPWDGRHGSDFFCTQQAWAGFKQFIKQDELCEILGLPKKPDDIDGSKVWDFYQAGEIARIEEYNRYDVDTVDELYKRLTFGA